MNVERQPDAAEERLLELAEIELRAAILMVADNPAYRMLLSGTAIDGPLLTEYDEIAASEGVVLERRIRLGGGWDVVVRAA
jgi:hypothetical protein